mgnify:CR=1 FL=1
MNKIMTLMMALMLTVTATAKSKIYNIKVKDGEGKEISMRNYKGKVLLIVNTATRCGFTPQYDELEALYEKYHAKGLEILDFPCNQFGGQAPGSFEEIHAFCTGKYNIQFDQFDKIEVNGPEESPLYTLLKSEQPFAGYDQNDPMGQRMHQMMERRDKDYAGKSDIKWNFTKFLVNRKGRVIRRFESTDNGVKLENAIKTLIGK